MEDEKLFTTDDGVDIYKKDRYYTVGVKDHEIRDDIRRFFKDKFNRTLPLVQPAGMIAGPYRNPKASEQSGTIKYFAYRENAEKFSAEVTK